MHDVKRAAGVSGIAAIVHHRWHHEAIFQREPPDRQRLEKPWPRSVTAMKSVTHFAHLLKRMIGLQHVTKSFGAKAAHGRHCPRTSRLNRENAAKVQIDQPCMMRCIMCRRADGSHDRQTRVEPCKASLCERSSRGYSPRTTKNSRSNKPRQVRERTKNAQGGNQDAADP